MNYRSSRGAAEKSGFCDAMRTALAPDGGLYVPEEFPALSEIPEDYAELSAAILAVYTDLPEEELLAQTRANYEDFPISVKKTASGDFLELFHGASGAFKDVALSLLPRLAALCELPATTYVTATSGDTGKAAMEAMKDRDDTKIMVFYPKDGVAFLQERQMATQEGDNVRVVQVEGDFDDAQRSVKQILSSFSEGVSSCNSINIARLISQIPYYFHAAGAYPKDTKLNFFVPCGNFGNILAGWYAKQMGLPVEKLVVCTNENTVLHDFFTSGVYDRRRELKKTSSPSMDILVSSNLERLLYHLLGAEETALRMRQLEEDGVFSVPEECLSDFSTASATEEEAGEAIRSVFEKTGYVIDPHTACARVAWEKAGCPEHSVILATASPSKFPETMIKSLEGTETGALEALEKLRAHTTIHPCIEAVLHRPTRFDETIRPEDSLETFRAFHGGDA